MCTAQQVDACWVVPVQYTDCNAHQIVQREVCRSDLDDAYSKHDIHYKLFRVEYFNLICKLIKHSSSVLFGNKYVRIMN
jgi:hypothetical protein